MRLAALAVAWWLVVGISGGATVGWPAGRVACRWVCVLTTQRLAESCLSRCQVDRMEVNGKGSKKEHGWLKAGNGLQLGGG